MTQYSRQGFIAALVPHVLRVRSEGSPMFSSVRLAQNILETGCQIHSWNNLGGIKMGSGKPNEYWRGKVVNKGTWEVYGGNSFDITTAFRAYDSLYDFYKDQDLLFQISRYARVRSAQTPEEQAVALYACGYATDPAYAGKLLAIIEGSNLKKYDEEDMESMRLTGEQQEMLVSALKDLVSKKVITDKAWITKAETKTLSLSELTWLNTIILARK